MKLVIGGATGFVGKELLKQALACPKITSIVTIGRRAVTEDANNAKLTDIVLDDLEHYPPSAIEKISNSDACIWTIAVTPRKSKTLPFEETRKTCLDYPLAAIKVLSESNKTEKPLRFVYYSGFAVNRDLTKKIEAMPEYGELRAHVELDLVDYAAKSHGAVEVTCVRPGFIVADPSIPVERNPALPAGIASIRLDCCVAASLKLAVEGIEMDPMPNDDFDRVGREALSKYCIV